MESQDSTQHHPPSPDGSSRKSTSEDRTPALSRSVRLDLSTAAAKRDGAAALPALMLGSAMGSQAASAMAGQILGGMISDALQPSIEAMNRLAAQNRITQ
jgi:hypothetical protein